MWHDEQILLTGWAIVWNNEREKDSELLLGEWMDKVDNIISN